MIRILLKIFYFDGCLRIYNTVYLLLQNVSTYFKSFVYKISHILPTTAGNIFTSHKK